MSGYRLGMGLLVATLVLVMLTPSLPSGAATDSNFGKTPGLRLLPTALTGDRASETGSPRTLEPLPRVGPFAYVTYGESSNVSVIDTSMETVLSNLRSGALTSGFAVFPNGPNAYVVNQYAVTFTETGLPSDSTWNATLNGVTQGASAGSDITFSEPNGTYAYNLKGPSGYALVSPGANGTVHVAGEPNTMVVPSIAAGNAPYGAAYDAANGCVYVTNYGGTNMTVINGTTNAVVATVGGVGAGDRYPAYDPVNGYIYVPSQGNGGVVVINGATNSVVTRIRTDANPFAVTYDSANGYLYVTSHVDDNVTVIDGATNQVVVPSIGVGSVPAGIAYDAANGRIYVANELSDNLTVIDGATNQVVVPSIGAGTSPEMVAYDPANGYLYVTNGGSKNVTVIDGATDRVVVPSIGAGIDPYGITYDSSNDYLYITNVLSHNETVIDGATNTVVTSVSGLESYSYGNVYDPANGYIYAMNEHGNNVTAINGNGIFVSHWGLAYSVSFTESGLRSGLQWNVTLNGVTQGALAGSDIVFSEPNGTYSYVIPPIVGYSTAGSGRLMVNGHNLTVNVTFVPYTYTVVFWERGLPLGTNWSVTVDGPTRSSTTYTITFTESNGTHSFSVGTLPGFSVSPGAGLLTVNGTPTSSVAITFTPVTFPVTVLETGLPSGTSWSATLGGTTLSSTTDTITFRVTNGTHSYSVGPVSGYSISPSEGMIDVIGGPVSVSLTFSKVSSTPAGSWWVWGIVAAISVLVMVGVVIFLMRRGKPARPSSGATESADVSDPTSCTAPSSSLDGGGGSGQSPPSDISA